MSRLVESISKQEEGEVFRKGVETIWKHCQPYLKQFISVGKKGEYLYSGRNTDSFSKADPIIKKKVRTNRKPTDTNISIHKDFDKEFQAQLGWPARSASLFTTGDRSSAQDYGNIYLVFPAGNFKYCYSPDVPDLYILLANKIEQPGGARGKHNQLMAQFVHELNAGKDVDVEFKEYYNHITQEGGEHGYWVFENEEDDWYNVPSTIKDFNEAIKFLENYYGDTQEVESELVVWYPELQYDKFYYKFFSKWVKDREASVYDEAQELYDQWIENIVQTYETATLKDAIESENEVMVNCKEWYGLDAQTFEWNLDGYFKKFGVKGHKNEEEFNKWWATK